MRKSHLTNAGQSSVELMLVVTLTILIIGMVIGRFATVQDSVFSAGSARQQIVTELEKMDGNYVLGGIIEGECNDSVRINVNIQPNPETIGTPTDASKITAKVQQAVASTRNLGPKTVCVVYNNPAELDCSQSCP